MKKILILLITIFLLSGCAPSQRACTMEAKLCPDGSAVGRSGPNCEFAACPSSSLDPKNATYIVNGQAVTLKDGVSVSAIEIGEVSKEVTKYFGNEARGDLNGDGQDDAAFLITQDEGGSGTFFYVTVLLGDGKTGTGINAILIGDRIAPQTTELGGGGMIIVNYADRKAGEPFTTKPSLGVSRYFKVIDNVLTEVKPILSESAARVIAEKTCIKGGEALSAGIYNEITKTWWFDANLNATKPGCNPACVVDETTKTAVINWRCTGLIEPTK
jgi:hypothetical protein